ncbi:MAG: AsmA-like C-terminal region-containing protein [Rickettsiaceae bacterium]
MKKAIIAVICLYFLSIVIMFSALCFRHDNSIQTNLAQILDIDQDEILIIDKKLKVNFALIPYIKISTLHISDKIKLQDITAHFSILSLLGFDPKLKTINVADGKLLYNIDNNIFIANHSTLVKQAANITEKINFNINIDYLIISDKDQADAAKISSLQINSRDIVGHIENIGTVKLSNRVVGNNNTEFTFDFILDNYYLRLSETYDKDNFIKGNGKFIIFTSKNHSQDELKILFDIHHTNNFVQYTNLDIKSNFLLANGRIDLSKRSNLKNKIQINASEVDLYYTSLYEVLNKLQNIDKIHNSPYIKFILADCDTDFEMQIDKILLNTKAFAKSLHARITSNRSGNITIEGVHANIIDDGNTHISGILTKHGSGTIFDAAIFMRHESINKVLNFLKLTEVEEPDDKSFSLSTKINTNFNNWHLSNILFDTDQLKIKGGLVADFSHHKPIVDVKLELVNIDLDNEHYPIISPLVNIFEESKSKMSALKDLFKNLQNKEYLTRFNFDLNNIKYQNNSFDKINLQIAFSPLSIDVNNFYLSQQKEYIDLMLKLFTASYKPELHISINSGSYQVVNLYRMLKTDYDVQANIKLDMLLNDLKLNGSCSNFSLFYDDFEFYNINFNISNHDGSLRFSKLSTEAFDGNINMNLDFNKSGLSFAYDLDQIALNKLSTLLPSIFVSNNTGKLDSSGNGYTNGSTLDELLYELYVESSYKFSNFIANNFSIDQFIFNLNNDVYNIDNLQDGIKEALDSGTTKFQQISGNLILKKGVFDFQDVSFKTNYASGKANSTINIYKDFAVDLSSTFQFQLNNPNNKDIFSVEVDAKGSLFDLKKRMDNTTQLMTIVRLR